MSRSHLLFVQNFRFFSAKKGKKSLGGISGKVRFCRLFLVFGSCCLRNFSVSERQRQEKSLSILYKTLYTRQRSKAIKYFRDRTSFFFLKSPAAIIYIKGRNPEKEKRIGVSVSAFIRKASLVFTKSRYYASYTRQASHRARWSIAPHRCAPSPKSTS